MAFTLTQPLYGQGGSYTAQQDRLRINSDASTAGVKKLTAPSGGVMTGDLAVTTTGAGNGSVNVAAGDVFIKHTTSGQGMYYANNDASTVVGSFAANSSGNPRIDLVCVLVTDTGATPSVAFSIVQGTPAASPVAPTPPAGSTAHYLTLAQVTIPNGFTVSSVVSAGNIVDVRPKAFVPDLSIQATPSSTGTMATQVPSPTDGQVLYSSVGKHLTAYNATTSAFEQVSPTAGFRNAIINGEFLINQRGLNASGQVGGVALTSGAYGQDRWRTSWVNGTVTYSAQAFALGNAIAGYEPTNYARVATTGQSAAGDLTIFNQRIEGVRTFAGQQITISFWAKAGSGTPKVAVEMEQGFGTGGSPSAVVDTYVGQATLSTSWTRYQLTISLPSISGKTLGTGGDDYLQLNLWTSAGTTYNARTGSLGIQAATIDFWGVQVEAGAFASPFERRPIGAETALCQRYYYRIGGAISTDLYYSCYQPASSFFRASYFHPVTMRAAPSVAQRVGIWAVVNSCGQPTVYYPTTFGYVIGMTLDAGVTNAFQSAAYTNATGHYLEFGAELA